MTNKLLTKVSLPYNITRGSFAFRQDKSIKLVDKLYKNICPKFKKGKLSYDELQKSIDEVLKKKIHIQTKKTNDPDFDGASDIIYSPISGCITGTTLELATQTNKIKIQDLITILHEFQHIADQLFHPKILKRNQHMSNNNMFTNKYNNLYDFIYKREFPINKNNKRKVINKIKYKILKFLRKMPIQDKIDYLQDIRYTLIMEDQAYKTQRKYAKIMNRKHIKINTYDLINENKLHMFKEKIKLINNIIFEQIHKERTKHARHLKKCKEISK